MGARAGGDGAGMPDGSRGRAAGFWARRVPVRSKVSFAKAGSIQFLTMSFPDGIEESGGRVLVHIRVCHEVLRIEVVEALDDRRLHVRVLGPEKGVVYYSTI